MKKITIKTLAMAAAVIASISSTALCSDADYRFLAESLARAAKENSTPRLVLGDFPARGEASKDDAALLSEKLFNYLSGASGVELIDPAALRKAAASGADNTELRAVAREARAQAVVTGTVFGVNGELNIMVRIVDARTGKVLAGAELNVPSAWPQLPSMPDPAQAPEPSLAPSREDLRDALNDDGCRESFARLNGLNEKLIGAKARFWAKKLKDPEFSYAKLSRNPGSEIKDWAVKEKFYAELAKWHNVERVPGLTPGETKNVEKLLDIEQKVINKCGLN